MSIQKKSLISTLKTTKKANIVKEDLGHAGSTSASVKSPIKVLNKINAPTKLLDKKMMPAKKS